MAQVWLRVRKAAFGKWSELWFVVTDAAIHPYQCPQHPVQSMFDDHGGGVEEGVPAAHSEENHETVSNLVCWNVLSLGSLAAHKVSKTNCAERHKEKVEGLHKSPALHG